MNRQKLRDAALLLPLLGVLLVMPPFVGLLSGPLTIFGLPAVVVYIFVIWAGLISLGIWLSGRLTRIEDPPPLDLAGMQGETDQGHRDADT